MSKSSDQRSHEVNSAINSTKSTVANEGVNRESLAAVLAVLHGLAARKDLWNATAFAQPDGSELQARYLIA